MCGPGGMRVEVERDHPGGPACERRGDVTRAGADLEDPVARPHLGQGRLEQQQGVLLDRVDLRVEQVPLAGHGRSATAWSRTIGTSIAPLSPGGDRAR